MKRIKSITFVVNDLNFLLSHRKNLIKFLQDNNQKINILCPKIRLMKRKKYNYNIINFFMRQRGKNIFFELLCFFDLLVKMLFVKTDIYHLISLKPIIYGSLVSKIFNKKIICSFSGLGYFKSMDKKKISSKILIFLLIYSLKNNKNSYLIFQNTSDQNILNSFLKFKKQNNYTLIQGSGVNTDKYYKFFNSKNLSDKKTFVYASRLIKEKGIIDFIEAAREFNKNLKIDKKKFTFLIAGKFIKNELKWKTKDDFISYINGLGENINYLDHQDEMDLLFKKASVIVLPTYYGEGVPKILLESLASGIPIITTFQRGCRELVDKGNNGFICRKKDPENLSNIFDKFQKLSNNDIYKMSLNCISYARKNLSINKVTKNHNIAYNYFE